MSYLVTDVMADYTDRSTGNRQIRASIVADTAADLPANTTALTWLLGSYAKTVDTGDEYWIDSSGSWILQPSAQYPNAYTKAQTDGLLSAHVCTCDTAAGTSDKVATTSDDFILREGAIVAVKFTNTNTQTDTSGHPITLNVNNTGAFRIYYANGGYQSAATTIAFGFAGRYIYYVYHDSRWVWLNINYGYNGMTSAQLNAGTNTENRVISAKTLHDFVFSTKEPLENALIDIINSGGKNTMKYTLTDLQTQNTGGGYGFTWTDNVCTSSRGVVFTVNADMSIQVQATAASGDVWFLLSAHDYDIGDWILSGCPAGGDTTKYYIESDNQNARDIGNSVQITAASAFTDNVYIVVKSGQTFDLTFKPMICDKSLYDVSPTYEPYCPTLAELYALVRSYHP